MERYESEIENDKNNTVVILENKDNDIYLRCRVKFYEDIDYYSKGEYGITIKEEIKMHTNVEMEDRKCQ